MSYKHTRKALYYRTTTKGKTKWVKVEGAQIREPLTTRGIDFPLSIELTDYRELYPDQQIKNPRIYVRE